jgi:hypothetical protein
MADSHRHAEPSLALLGIDVYFVIDVDWIND